MNAASPLTVYVSDFPVVVANYLVNEEEQYYVPPIGDVRNTRGGTLSCMAAFKIFISRSSNGRVSRDLLGVHALYVILISIVYLSFVYLIIYLFIHCWQLINKLH